MRQVTDSFPLRPGAMEFRSFLNTDVPEIVRLWNQQAIRPGRYARLTPAILETHVLSKLYFRPDGLIVACDGPRLWGFTHFGFAPTPDETRLDFECGVICLVITDVQSSEAVYRDLLQRAESDLAHCGSATVNFASRFPHTPFYKGLLGGTFVPGVDTNDQRQIRHLESLGFACQNVVDVYTLTTLDYRPPVDRQIVMAKRKYELRVITDPSPASWWQANQSAFRYQLDYRMVDRKSNRECGYASFWSITPTETAWDSTSVGMGRIEIGETYQRQGLGKTLLTEAIRELARRNVATIEAQVPRDNLAGQELVTRVGFQLQYSAVQLGKNLKSTRESNRHG